MDIGGVRKMADKIAAEDDLALNNVETAVDNIIVGIKTIDDNLDEIQATTPEEKKAVESIRELIDTAVAPYTADIMKALEVFDEGE